MDLKKLLSSSSYTVINKHLMKKIGLEETFMLQYLLDLQDNCFNGEFFQQQSRLSFEFGWSLQKVKNVLSNLKSLGLLNVIKKGLPARNYYTINKEVVLELFKDQSTQNELSTGKVIEFNQNEFSVNSNLAISELKSSLVQVSNQAHIKQNKEEQNKKNKIIIDNIDREWTADEVKVFDECIKNIKHG